MFENATMVHELYDIAAKLPTTVIQSIRILLTALGRGTPAAGIGKPAFLVYFVIRHLHEPIPVALHGP